MDVNTYLAKTYSAPPCWELVADVHAHEVGLPVNAYKTINSSLRMIAAAFRIALHKAPEGFSPTDTPSNFSIVLLGKNERLGFHHCGIWYESAVLHALNTGNLYQDIASIRDEYALIEFWSRA